MCTPRIILASLPSFFQTLSKLVEIWRSSDKNNFAQFFETRCMYCCRLSTNQSVHSVHYLFSLASLSSLSWHHSITVSFYIPCGWNSLVATSQYQCNWLPGKTRLWNDLLRVEWDVKPYTLTHCLCQSNQIKLGSGNFSALMEVRNASSNILYCIVITCNVIYNGHYRILSYAMMWYYVNRVYGRLCRSLVVYSKTTTCRILSLSTKYSAMHTSQPTRHNIFT